MVNLRWSVINHYDLFVVDYPAVNICVKKLSISNDTITATISKLCQRHGVRLVLNDPDVPKDNGCTFDDEEIHLGNQYSSRYIFLAIALHEFSHAIIYKRYKENRSYKKMSIFQEETLAWTLAMDFQKTHFGRGFTKSQGEFMVQCLNTYSKTHYNFSKSYND